MAGMIVRNDLLSLHKKTVYNEIEISLLKNNLEKVTDIHTTRKDLLWLQLAKDVAQQSPDPSTKTGAIIVKDGRMLATGFNHLPTDILLRSKDKQDEILNNRDEKYKYIVHCEIDALCKAGNVSGATLYTYPFISCDRCCSIFQQTGITRVVTFKAVDPRWIEESIRNTDRFLSIGIQVTLYEREQELDGWSS